MEKENPLDDRKVNWFSLKKIIMEKSQIIKNIYTIDKAIPLKYLVK